MRWPALVVGHRGTGKTSVIKGLAAAVGARLTEVAMTPSVDVTELLGCFQQVQQLAVSLCDLTFVAHNCFSPIFVTFLLEDNSCEYKSCYGGIVL